MNTPQLLRSFIRLIEHNEHALTIRFLGKEIHPCARCFGTILGSILAFPICLSLYLTATFDFTTIFILSWIFASFALIDWTTIKLHFREGDNNIRAFTGFFLGAGIMIFIFLLPNQFLFPFDLLVNYLAIMIFFGAFSLIQPYVHNKDTADYNISKAIPLAAVSGACGHTGGCTDCLSPGAMCCTCSPCCICVIGIPAICLIKSLLDKQKVKKNDK